MEIYIFDEDTKEYLRAQKAQPNPRKEGEYLFPVNSTTEQLPEYGENEIPVFVENHWAIKPDFRGQYVLDIDAKDFVKVDYIGEIKEGQILMPLDILKDYMSEPEAYKIENGKLVSIRGTKEYAQHLEELFDKNFIETDYGYVRINTTWGNFITIKPNYDMQVNLNGYLPQDVIILYKKPDFEEFTSFQDVENWLKTEGNFKNEQMSFEDYNLFSAQILEKFTKEIE